MAKAMNKNPAEVGKDGEINQTEIDLRNISRKVNLKYLKERISTEKRMSWVIYSETNNFVVQLRYVLENVDEDKMSYSIFEPLMLHSDQFETKMDDYLLKWPYYKELEKEYIAARIEKFPLTKNKTLKQFSEQVKV